MNAAHVHLLLHHVPVLGTVFGVLLLAVARMRRSDELVRTGLGFFILLAVIAIVVQLTGDAAEDLVKNLQGISEATIERHEESAFIATIVLGLFGAMAAAALLAFRRRALPRWLAMAALILSLVPTGFMAWTANLGGQIRHTEIQGAAPAGAEGQREE
jgi:uncharacterized membrane protein YeaQ/YmgE (transglycosylase-associated protein family)